MFKNEIHARLLTLTAQIVGAHVARNDTPVDTLPRLIADIYATLAEIGGDGGRAAPRQSIASAAPHVHDHDHRHAHGSVQSDDYLVCLEDGLTMKMLKRHLLTVHGLTPDEYRAKWGLPDDYPMVAANYAKLRSSLAKESGLGLRPEARNRRYRS